MSASTPIEWTRSDDGSAGATWNPVTGCTKVSEGCDHCYAETFAERWRGVPGHPFEQGFDVRLWPERLTLPLRWRRPRRVFLNSMSDLWHDAVGADLIARVFAVIAVAEQHTFQVLTKRPGRMHSLLSDEAFWHQVQKAAAEYGPSPEAMAAIDGRFLPNLWLGVSVETQKWASVRLDKLAATSAAAVRFASCEPLLGELDIRSWLAGGLQWVIAGGESGPGARPMHPDWARSLRDQCQDAGVPYFFKQWGAFAPEADGHDRGGIHFIDRRGQSWNAMEIPARPDAVGMRRVGKGRAGRMLDDRTWDEFPGRRLLAATHG
jgi:protein gp37